MVVSALLLAGTVYLFGDRAEGLHPQRRHRPDQRQHRVRVQGVGYDATVARISADHGDRCQNDPERRRVHRDSAAGGSGCNVDLKPRDERNADRRQVIEELRPKLDRGARRPRHR